MRRNETMPRIGRARPAIARLPAARFLVLLFLGLAEMLPGAPAWSGPDTGPDARRLHILIVGDSLAAGGSPPA